MYICRIKVGGGGIQYVHVVNTDIKILQRQNSLIKFEMRSTHHFLNNFDTNPTYSPYYVNS